MMNIKMLGIGLLFSFTALVNAANTDIMAIKMNGKQPTFQIILDANPSTGYQWTLQNYDQSFLKLIGSQYLPSKTNLIGAGGKMLFTFGLMKGKTYPKTTELLFRYARSWEPKSGTLKKVTVNFQTP